MNLTQMCAAMALGAYVLLLVQINVGIRDDRRTAKAPVFTPEQIAARVAEIQASEKV